jgi:hypothetical protein
MVSVAWWKGWTEGLEGVKWTMCDFFFARAFFQHVNNRNKALHSALENLVVRDAIDHRLPSLRSPEIKNIASAKSRSQTHVHHDNLRPTVA